MNYNYKYRRAVKEPATVEKQLDKLISRGLVITDRESAGNTLETINYYRLVNYFAVFAAGKNNYKPGTTFEMGLRLYDFDRRLRNALLIVLEEIEVAFRAVISNYHALKYGALGYLNSEAFDAPAGKSAESQRHKYFLGKIDRLVETNSDLGFVRHHNDNYGGAFPLWVIMELFSFGMLNYFYSDMKKTDKKELAEKIFPPPSGITYQHIASWLECLADLRNHCAHYNRIYAALPEIAPKTLGGECASYGNSLFHLVTIMKRLHKRPEIWNGVFLPLVRRLFTEYADVIDISVMGFPPDWETLLSALPLALPE